MFASSYRAATARERLLGTSSPQIGYAPAPTDVIRKALDWVVPYSTGEKKWPYAQIEPYNSSDLAPALLRAAYYRDGNYLTLVKPEHAGKDVPTKLLRLAAEK